MRSLDGKPVIIKPGTSDRMNKALLVLGFAPAISQTQTVLKIGKAKINCPRTYETMKSIEFDNKVRKALREFCQVNGIDTDKINKDVLKINEKLKELGPKSELVGFARNINSNKEVQRWLAQAKAVEEFYAQPEVQETLEAYEALQELFKNDWNEVVVD